MAKTSKLLLSTVLCSAWLAGAANAAEIETNMAKMQAMDKVTGRVSEITVPVNGETVFGTFSIVVRYCATRSPEETPENYAFVDVVDNYAGDKPVNIFKGWMLSSSPALNAVEHPIYDVWLLKCYNADEKTEIKKLSAEQLKARDEIEKAQPQEKQLSAEAKKALAEEEAAETAARAKAEAEALKAAQEAEEKLKSEAPATEAAAANPAAEKAQPEVKPLVPEMIPAAGDETEVPLPETEGAPKPLIQINQPAVPAETLVPEVVTADENIGAPAADIIEKPAVVEDVVSEQEAKPETPLVAEEPTLPPEKMVLKTETTETAEIAAPADPVVADEGLLIPDATTPSENSEQGAPAQLIQFDDEVEEEGFDLDAEALVN